MSLANTGDYTVEETMERRRKGEGTRERIKRVHEEEEDVLDGEERY